MSVIMTHNVGVAPGTTTMQLGQIGSARRWLPWTDVISLNESIAPPRIEDRRIRWDLVAIIGGGSLIVALGAAFIAAAFARYVPEPRD